MKSTTYLPKALAPSRQFVSAVRAVPVNIEQLELLYLFVFTHYPYAKPLRTFAGNALIILNSKE
jgi:hypothetical protein